MNELRLTQFAHGGGCGCKLAPSVLADIMARMPKGVVPPALMVGTETGDDAAVYRLSDDQALVATTDFFTPIVDDPADFGRIAATNALSDVYAMGGRPVLALAVVGMPLGKLPVAAMQDILRGGAEVCAAAGIPVAGGHSIDSPEPIYGLVAIGLVHPDRVLRNSGAREGDALVLLKPLGVGIYSAALKRGALPDALYAELIRTTTRLNTPGARLAQIAGVHGCTDVTGFGLLGHTLEMCAGSGLRARINQAAIPWLPEVQRLARDGFATGASDRNWASHGSSVTLPDGTEDWERGLLCDPQTSGGLLVACAPDAADQVLDLGRSEGFASASVIGRMEAGGGVAVVRERSAAE